MSSKLEQPCLSSWRHQLETGIPLFGLFLRSLCAHQQSPGLRLVFTNVTGLTLIPLVNRVVLETLSAPHNGVKSFQQKLERIANRKKNVITLVSFHSQGAVNEKRCSQWLPRQCSEVSGGQGQHWQHGRHSGGQVAQFGRSFQRNSSQQNGRQKLGQQNRTADGLVVKTNSGSSSAEPTNLKNNNLQWAATLLGEATNDPRGITERIRATASFFQDFACHFIELCGWTETTAVGRAKHWRHVQFSIQVVWCWLLLSYEERDNFYKDLDVGSTDARIGKRSCSEEPGVAFSWIIPIQCLSSFPFTPVQFPTSTLISVKAALSHFDTHFDSSWLD